MVCGGRRYRRCPANLGVVVDNKNQKKSQTLGPPPGLTLRPISDASWLWSMGHIAGPEERTQYGTPRSTRTAWPERFLGDIGPRPG